MIKRFVCLWLLIMFPLALFADVRISGVDVEDSMTLNGVTYDLSGAGVRRKLVLRLYVGSLYTDRTISDGSTVLWGPTNSIIQLDIISKLITSELMAETVQEGFEKAMGGDTGDMQPKIDDFIAVFSEEIVKGDIFTFLSQAGEGVLAFKNGRVLTEIPDDEFRQYLFSIWLGDDPADDRLKEAMLGE